TPNSCGTDGKCDGNGHCESYVAGTTCGPTMCSGGTQNGQSCNGSGSCVASNQTACSPYVCGASACTTTCTSDAGCIASYYCSIPSGQTVGTCQPDQANSASCTSGTQCTSGNCVDNFCCDSVCDGLCQACSAAKSVKPNGTCGNIK